MLINVKEKQSDKRINHPKKYITLDLELIFKNSKQKNVKLKFRFSSNFYGAKGEI